MALNPAACRATCAASQGKDAVEVCLPVSKERRVLVEECRAFDSGMDLAAAVEPAAVADLAPVAGLVPVADLV